MMNLKKIRNINLIMMSYLKILMSYKNNYKINQFNKQFQKIRIFKVINYLLYSIVYIYFFLLIKCKKNIRKKKISFAF
jgi:hypothetical protein